MSITIENQTASGQPAAAESRRVWPAMWAGYRQKCPKCETGSLFESYLKVKPVCAECGEELHHHRADDAPPYFTIFIAGHIVVGGVLALEKAIHPSAWVHALIWLPLTLLLCLWMLPRIKGALVGLQWALRMHGFDGQEADEMVLTSDRPPSEAPSAAKS